MYKEVTTVLTEVLKRGFHKMKLIKDFLVNVVVKNFNNIPNSMHFSEGTMLDLVQLFLQVENFSQFSS